MIQSLCFLSVREKMYSTVLFVFLESCMLDCLFPFTTFMHFLISHEDGQKGIKAQLQWIDRKNILTDF